MPMMPFGFAIAIAVRAKPSSPRTRRMRAVLRTRGRVRVDAETPATMSAMLPRVTMGSAPMECSVRLTSSGMSPMTIHERPATATMVRHTPAFDFGDQAFEVRRTPAMRSTP
ncbi:hypothetical protein CI784_00125 [Arthrobacter agilis]|nr:hypothetical protein B8W74_00115 [Arthrobacter agilis]PPB47795.1 hypothetical protein CI784_00125 [Arthrobacter agilis]